MKDNKNITIALLAVAATILATVLVLMSYTGTPAYAGPPVVGGDYLMVNAAASDTTDLLYVVDVAQQKMCVYRIDPNQGNNLVLVDQLNLKKEFAAQ